MNNVIKPTVGRKVWYRPSPADKMGSFQMSTVGDQPLDATIIAVWGDRMVNVLVTDTMGKQFPVLSCALLQAGDEPAKDIQGNPVGRYVEWMPHQVGQSRKDEAIDRVIAAVAVPAGADVPLTVARGFTIGEDQADNSTGIQLQMQMQHVSSELTRSFGVAEATKPGESPVGFSLDSDKPLAGACDLSGEGTCDACQ